MLEAGRNTDVSIGREVREGAGQIHCVWSRPLSGKGYTEYVIAQRMKWFQLFTFTPLREPVLVFEMVCVSW